DGGAERDHAAVLRLVYAARDVDLGGDPELARHVRHRLAVVAGRARHDAAPAVLLGEAQEREEGATDLEGSRQLQRRELQEDGDAGGFRKRRRRLDRRAADAPLEGPAGLEDQRHVERGHGSTNSTWSARAISPRTRSASAGASAAVIPATETGGSTSTVA